MTACAKPGNDTRRFEDLVALSGSTFVTLVLLVVEKVGEIEISTA